MKKQLRSLITVNTFDGSDNFYFKNPAKVGTVDGKDAYCVFYYSHYDEYMVFAIAWVDEGFNFHYLNENDMKPTYEHKFRTLNVENEFVKATDIINIVPNYMELIFDATQKIENIEHNIYYRNLYNRERDLQYYLNEKREEVGYNQYEDSTYLEEYSMRLDITEYSLLNERYVNLQPDIEREKMLAEKRAFTKEQILSQREADKKISTSMNDILNEILNK